MQRTSLLPSYFDLYTSVAHPMNVYSKFFANKLGFRNVDTARRSVAIIDKVYQQFAQEGDRAGQRHALAMALTMFNRARWTGKEREADIFRQWLMDQLTQPLSADAALLAITAALGPETDTTTAQAGGSAAS